MKIHAMFGMIGGKKLTVAWLTAAVIILNRKLGLDLSVEDMKNLCMAAAAYVLGQGVADGLTGGKTSSVAALLDSEKPRGGTSGETGSGGAGPVVAVLLGCSLLFCGGCSSRQAELAVVEIGQSAVAYRNDVGTMVEAFISDYRRGAQAKVDELTDKAIASETKLTADGQALANAKNVQIHMENKIRQYGEIELNCAAMRANLIRANKNQDNVIQYAKALKEYFAKQTSSQEMLQQSSQMVFNTLDQIVKKK